LSPAHRRTPLDHALLPGNEDRRKGSDVPTGAADQFVIVTFAENNLLRVSGYISISVAEFFHVGQFSFAQSGTPQTVRSPAAPRPSRST
jgi:hypothetical protein